LLAGVSLLRRCVLLRLGRDTVDLGVGLSLDQRGVRFFTQTSLGLPESWSHFSLATL
jgi:hypothetical protein